MIDTEKMIAKKYPSINRLPTPAKTLFFYIVKKMVYEDAINLFLKEHQNSSPFVFIKSVLEYFNFSYKVQSNQIENIPPTGRVIIIANHPLGALDALSLIDMVKSVRSDIKVVANDLLSNIPQLKEILISVDAINKKLSVNALNEIYQALDNENALIIFPSGEVSRASHLRIKDTKWSKGFLKFAKAKNVPILPIYQSEKLYNLLYCIFYKQKSINCSFTNRDV